MPEPIEPTAVMPTVDEAPAAEAKAVPARSVDDFLTDLDAVLNEATALTIPAPDTAPDPEPDATATMPDVDPDVDAVEPPAATIPTPAPTPAAERDRAWWDPLYKDDTADQDTFTGNVPAATVPAPAAPPKPTNTPNIPATQVDDGDDSGQDDESDEADDAAPKRAWDRLKKKTPTTDDADHDDVDEGDEGDEGDEAPAKPTQKRSGKESPKKAGAAVAGAADGLINNPRGRQVIFAGTAAGLGWGLHLNDVATNLMTHAAQYATPVAGCTLCFGILGLAMRSKFGVVVFVSSLGLITALEMADPARIVGGGLTLGLQVAYRMVRRWVGPYGSKWPWKGVVWFAHVPAATATVAFLLYGTN